MPGIRKKPTLPRIRDRKGMPSAWWLADIPRGTFPSDTGDVGDLTGSTPAGTRNAGCTFASGPAGQCLLFDGSTGYVNLGNASTTGALKPPLPITIVASVRPDRNDSAIGGNNQQIFANDGFASSPLNSYAGICLATGSANGWMLAYGDGGTSHLGNTRTVYTADNLWVPGDWHRVVGVISGTNAFAVYMDGVLLYSGASTYGTGGALAYTSAPASLSQGASNVIIYPLQGALDDVRLYRRAWTAADVAQDMGDRFKIIRRPSRAAILAASVPGAQSAPLPAASLSLAAKSLSIVVSSTLPTANLALAAASLGSVVSAALPTANLALAAASLGSVVSSPLPAANLALAATPLGSVVSAPLSTADLSLAAAPLGSVVSAPLPTANLALAASPPGSIVLAALPAANLTLAASSLGDPSADTPGSPLWPLALRVRRFAAPTSFPQSAALPRVGLTLAAASLGGILVYPPGSPLWPLALRVRRFTAPASFPQSATLPAANLTLAAISLTRSGSFEQSGALPAAGLILGGLSLTAQTTGSISGSLPLASLTMGAKGLPGTSTGHGGGALPTADLVLAAISLVRPGTFPQSAALPAASLLWGASPLGGQPGSVSFPLPAASLILAALSPAGSAAGSVLATLAAADLRFAAVSLKSPGSFIPGSPLWPFLLLGFRRAKPIPTTLFEAIRNYFLSLPSVADVGLTDIYKNRPKKGWVFPYMVINSVNGSDDLNTSTSWMRSTEYQFSVLGSDDLQVDAISEAAYRALLPKPPNPTLVFSGGLEIVRWPLYHDRSSEQPGRASNNVNVWKSDFGYSIMTSRSM